MVATFLVCATLGLAGVNLNQLRCGRAVELRSPRPRLIAPAEVETISSAAPPQTRAKVLRPELDEWRDFEELRDGVSGSKLRDFFASRPALVAGRLARVGTTLQKAKADWEASEGLANGEKSDEFDQTKDVRGEAPDEGTRGASLCEAMASLGPVSVKISQTLSQRPDL